jgi:predicted anti-sigma-YlaC factor YlaD
LSAFNIATRDSGREHLAALIARNSRPEEQAPIQYFTCRLKPDWWVKRDRSFSELSEDWRKAERLAIGTSLPVLADRLAGRQTLLDAIQRGVEAGNAGDSFIRYLHRLLEMIMFKGMQADIPDAVQYVASRLAERKNRASRAPMEIMLKVPLSAGIANEKSINFSSLMLNLAAGDARAASLLNHDINRALRYRPDILFAITAALALQNESWNEAERFADNALKAAETLHLLGAPDGLTGPEVPVAEPEYRYLLAISRRFIIGSRSPPKRTERDPWRDDTQRSIKDLAELEGLHAQSEQSRRQARAIAEQAAVRLFYAGWAACKLRDGLDNYGVQFSHVVEQFNAAAADIRRGWALCDTLEHRHQADSIVRNLSINAASLAVIGRILSRQASGLQALTIEELKRVELECQLVLKHVGSYPQIVALDALAFLVIIRHQHDMLDRLCTTVKEGSQFGLPLDEALALAIESEVAMVPNTKRTPSARPSMSRLGRSKGSANRKPPSR